jgi:hypothetical protein
VQTRTVRRTITMGAAVTLAFLVASCGSPGDAKKADYQTTVYQGKTLYCSVMQSRDDEHSYDCDFEGMYRGNPNPPAVTGSIREGFFTIVTVDYAGKPLTCLTYPAPGDYFARICDLAKYHREQTATPEPSPSASPLAPPPAMPSSTPSTVPSQSD